MSYEHLIWEQDGGVGRITLNRPDSLNAWNQPFGRELRQVIEADAADESVRAVLITGAGRGFSSGADLKAGFDQADDGMPDVRKELVDLYHPIIAGVRRLEKPVVAAVNGPAVGIGASLALACDLVLAAESAYFGLAFVNIGLMPDGGSTLFVPAAVGKARAFQMALLGERVDSARALDWGLVNFVHPDDTMLDEAGALAEKLAAGPTRSYAGSKRRSTGCSTPTSRASSTSRPSCSTRSRAPRTSRRACSLSWRSARPSSRGPDPPRIRVRAPRFGASGTKWSLRPKQRYDPRALPTGMPRRLLLAALAAALLAFLVAAPAAFADAFTPESGGSPNADDIDTLYKITLYVGLVIFLIVEGTLLWSLVRHRARRGGPEAAQIRGNTPLELGWTLGAALILVVLTVVTFLYLPDIENPPASGPNGLRASQAQFASIDQPSPPRDGGPILRIRVNGQQYLWRYDYGAGNSLFTYYGWWCR